MSKLGMANEIFNQGLAKVKRTPVPIGQKFAPGTFVTFNTGIVACVEYTYAHAYWGDDVKSYTLLIRFGSDAWFSMSWVQESRLTAITDPSLIEQYQKEVALLCN